MKAVIWIASLIIFAIVHVVISNFVRLGAVGEALYWAAFFGLCYWLSRKWDAHKAEKAGKA